MVLERCLFQKIKTLTLFTCTYSLWFVLIYLFTHLSNWHVFPVLEEFANRSVFHHHSQQLLRSTHVIPHTAASKCKSATCVCVFLIRPFRLYLIALFPLIVERRSEPLRALFFSLSSVLSPVAAPLTPNMSSSLSVAGHPQQKPVYGRHGPQ